MSKTISISISDSDYARLESTCGKSDKSMMEEAAKIFHAGLMTTFGMSRKETAKKVAAPEADKKEASDMENNVRRFERRGAQGNAKIAENMVNSQSFKNEFMKMLEEESSLTAKKSQNPQR